MASRPGSPPPPVPTLSSRTSEGASTWTTFPSRPCPSHRNETAFQSNRALRSIQKGLSIHENPKPPPTTSSLVPLFLGKGIDRKSNVATDPSTTRHTRAKSASEEGRKRHGASAGRVLGAKDGQDLDDDRRAGLPATESGDRKPRRWRRLLEVSRDQRKHWC